MAEIWNTVIPVRGVCKTIGVFLTMHGRAHGAQACLYLCNSISIFYVCLVQVYVSISTVIGGALRHCESPSF